MTRRFPVATVLIVLGTVSYSILRFNQEDVEIKEYLNSAATKELFRARADLTLKNCLSLGFDEDLCGRLGKVIDAKTPIHPLDYQDKLAKESAGDRFKSEIPVDDIRFLFQLLFKDKTWLDRAKEFQQQPEYAKFLQAREAFKNETGQRHRKHARLSGLNINFRSLIEAQLTHAGWLHLIGNMVFFLLLAIPAEERLGSLALLGVYLAGGFIGLSLHILTDVDPTQSLLGASANVSSIAGVFLALFWNVKMRIWLSAFFMWNKVVFIPTRVFIPVFIVSHDVVGTLAQTGQVAHLAHLGGMVAGVLSGVFWIYRHPLEGGAVFPFENDLLQAGRASEKPSARLQKAHEVLFYHHDNVEAQDILLETILSAEKNTWADLSKLKRKILKMHFSKVFKRYLGTVPSTFCLWMTKIPVDWPLNELATGVDLEALHAAIVEAENQERVELAVRLLRLLEGFAHSESNRQKIRQRITALHNRSPHGRLVS